VSLFLQLTDEWQAELSHHRAVIDSIDERLHDEAINPDRAKIFRALEQPMSTCSVVIVGQDPYPNAEDACGLAFSLPAGHRGKVPPTLRNILQELEDDVGSASVKNGDLTPWTDQGVVLLNRILTTKSGESLAHKDWGWQNVTDAIVARLVRNNSIFILWGNFARDLSSVIPQSQRVESVHPSPLSAYRGFFGSRPFSTTSERLRSVGRDPINW